MAVKSNSLILYDERDEAFLNLDNKDKKYLPNVFKDLNFTNSEVILESVVTYSYENLLFASKLLLDHDILPYQALVLKYLFSHQFPMLIASRGFAKSSMLAWYAVLRALLIQGSRIVIVSGGFRQAKTVFNYINDMYLASTTLKQICGRGNHPKFDISACYFKIGKSKITCLPLGDGSKIRGERANCIIVDEYGSVNEEVYESVVAPFAAVSLDPVSKVKELARLREMKEQGIDISEFDQKKNSNQIVISGTATYQFENFYKKYRKYQNIIRTRGDFDKLREVLGEDSTDDELLQINPSEYCILKIPHTEAPILDETIVTQARATMTKSKFAMEYGASFYADSEGFIPRSLIEANSLYLKFPPLAKGKKTRRYVMGVDPARKRDNFAIVIMEIDDSSEKKHKIVYCWATNEKKMKETGEIGETQTYYSACAKKIRGLTKVFNIIRINMDAGGGGSAIADALKEGSMLEAGEFCFYEVDRPEERLYEGQHILKLISSSPKWASESNHSFRKYIEDYKLLFPIYSSEEIERDSLENPDLYLEEIISQSVGKTRRYMKDTIQDICDEIQEMKDEIGSIVITSNMGGSEHFDLPKFGGGIGGNVNISNDVRRKDRYSAAVLAFCAIKELCEEEKEAVGYETFGGIATEIEKSYEGEMYRGLPAGVKSPFSGNACEIITNNGKIFY